MSVVTAPGGQEISYVDHGGDGPAVVLLHSFLMDGTMWQPQVDAFGADFRLIAVDERGHGQTPADADFTYWDVAGDVVALLDHLDIDRAAMVGTSQGGFVALRVALLAPERVSALVLLGSSAMAENPDVADAYRGLSATWTEQGPIDPVLDTVASICVGDFDASDWKARWRQVEPTRFARNLEALVSRDGILDRLASVTAPALVLHGSADAAYPLGMAEAMVAALPNAEPLVVIDEGAHFLSLTAPDEVNPRLQEFLGANA